MASFKVTWVLVNIQVILFLSQVPNGFTAVMSASKWEHRKEDNTFLFTMEQPIPSYLVALAVGDLVSAEVGPRLVDCAISLHTDSMG